MVIGPGGFEPVRQFFYRGPLLFAPHKKSCGCGAETACDQKRLLHSCCSLVPMMRARCCGTEYAQIRNLRAGNPVKEQF